MKHRVVILLGFFCLSASAQTNGRNDCTAESFQFIQERIGDYENSPWERFIDASQGAVYAERTAIYLEDGRVDLFHVAFEDGSTFVSVTNRADSSLESFFFRLPDCKAVVHKRPKEQTAGVEIDSAKARVLDDALLAALTGTGTSFWVFAVSERMPLSFDMIPTVETVAKRMGKPFVIVVDPRGGGEDQLERVGKLINKPAKSLMILGSKRLYEKGIGNHFPNLAVYEGGRFDRLVTGYKEQKYFARLMDRPVAKTKRQKPQPDEDLLRFQARTSAGRSVRVHLETEQVIEHPRNGLGYYFGSYFRPMQDRNIIVYIDSEANIHLHDIKPNKRMAFSQYDVRPARKISFYDVIPFPGSEAVMTFNRNYTISAISLEEYLVGNGPPRFMHQEDSGNIYPSVGLLKEDLGGRTYRVLTNWGPTYSQEWFMDRDDSGRMRIEPISDREEICANYSLSTPHVGYYGEHLTGELLGQSMLLRISDHDPSNCEIVHELGIQTSKMQVNRTLDAFAFHSWAVSLSENWTTWDDHYSFLYDRESGRIFHLEACGDSEYPSFLSGNRVVCYEEGYDGLKRMRVLSYRFERVQ